MIPVVIYDGKELAMFSPAAYTGLERSVIVS